MRWLIREVPREVPSDAVERLAGNLHISPLLSRLLILRGLHDPGLASRFLNPQLCDLHDPFAMLGMDRAVRRIFQAVERREKILIYGDYDVDGSLAVVVLRMALSLIGANADYHIPHRIRDGYGMREEVIERAALEKFSLIVSVDTGIRDFPVVERARQLGIEYIITDHHLPLESAKEGDDFSSSATSPAEIRIPPAVAVLNPKQPACSYPDKNLSGVGVAFKLAQALLQSHPEHSRRLEVLLPSFLKLVCIGTIADSVPLLGENRVIARLGLEGLANPVNHGLRALLEVAGLNNGKITASDVGFRLAPRLNAAGRMESAEDVINLFLNAGSESAQQIAAKLNRLNSDRQRAEQTILADLETRYEQQPDLFAEPVIVLEGRDWHRGVIGIVASRIMERFSRPTLVIACEDASGHGSGRSLESFHLMDALTHAGDLFDRFGGHACAAGFVIPVPRIAELRQRLNHFAALRPHPESAEPEMFIDAEVSLDDLSTEGVLELERLGPHGYGNPQPVFVARKTSLSAPPRLLKEKHLKLQIVQQGRSRDAIAWRKGGWLDQLNQPAAQMDFAFHAALNHFRNRTETQLELLDLKTSSSS